MCLMDMFIAGLEKRSAFSVDRDFFAQRWAFWGRVGGRFGDTFFWAQYRPRHSKTKHTNFQFLL